MNPRTSPILSLLLGLLCGSALAQDVGPVVGHVDRHTAHLLLRRGEVEGRYRLHLASETAPTVEPIEAEARAQGDFVARFEVRGLQPDTLYRYRIDRLEGTVETAVAEGEDLSFRTASDERRGGDVTLCFTSCVDIETNPMWDDVAALGPDLLLLMGDTPYIDSSDLGVARRRHREFLAMPGLADLVRSIPTVGTWDDHDFGRNNGNGRNMAGGKHATRQAFAEYRAHDRYGTGEEGVFHGIDLGMIEVFLLDPRTFAQTGPSPVDPRQPTCFGHAQWEWLAASLRASEAPFKVLAQGAIWQDKKNGETDDLFTYWYERDALLDLIEREGIGGVVLLGGDIHVSRHLVHRQRVGYDLHDLVVSPGHERTITGLDVFHPDLAWSLVEGRQFLSLRASDGPGGPTLTARFQQAGGRVNRVVQLTLDELTPRRGEGLERDLRAWWAFEDGLAGRGPLANHLPAVPSHPDLVQQDPQRGGALRLDRAQEQFLRVAGNPLDDNSAAHSLALWMRPEALPAHGTEERMFLLESTAERQPSGASAWHLSLGLRAAPDPSQVNLELHTHTLWPAAAPEAAPTAHSQGGFACLLDRSELEGWTHLACTFDSTSWRLYVDGAPRAQHRLPVPGPASEFGGLVIGGHRAGAGRNLDGWIDDLALWARVLEPEEIRSLAGKAR